MSSKLERKMAQGIVPGLFSSKEEEVEGQKAAWRFTFAFTETFTAMAALKLGIPDILAAEGPDAKLTVAEIGQRLQSRNPLDLDVLNRIMRFLVAQRFFSAEKDAAGDGVTRYGLTPASKWLLTPAESGHASLKPMFLMVNHECVMGPWHRVADCVTHGVHPFSVVHGCGLYEYASRRPEFNAVMNEAMVTTNAVFVASLLDTYASELAQLSSVVDVGGGLGATLESLVRAYPNITTAINFDLPHVIQAAPQREGITHVAGDMFKEVPKADVAFIKWVLVTWTDEECVKILSNCRKAIPADKGKVIIVESVVEDDVRPHNRMDEVNVGLAIDVNMMAVGSGGKERTKSEWGHVLQAAEFRGYKFKPLPAPDWRCIIEAFP